MRAHQIMSKPVLTVTPDTPIIEAAKLMLQHHVSGLPVVDEAGALVGIVSEGDFLRRSEIGTARKRSRWLQFLIGPGGMAEDFVRERGHKVGEVMTRDLVIITEDTPLDELVHLMEKKGIKRLPVLRGSTIVGIVTRSDLLQAVASMARDIKDPTADDDHIRERLTRQLIAAPWAPLGVRVLVRDGVVHLHGLITDHRTRQAALVAAENTAGVKEVHDHLCLVDTYSGFYVESPEDLKAAS